MKIAVAHLESLSSYGQSKKVQTPRAPKANAQEHEEQTWRERMHVDENGWVFIPPMQFKKSIEIAAKFLSEKVPGKSGGKATYTKHFKAGILVPEGLTLPIKAADVQGEWLFLPANGQSGSGTRVNKCMPIVASWEGDVRYYVLDDTITQEVFEHTLVEAGQFIGIGFFRPERGGYRGRYAVKGVSWE